MRWFAFVLLLMVSADIRAGEFFLIPENNPKPIYPLALLQGRDNRRCPGRVHRQCRWFGQQGEDPAKRSS